MRQKTRLFLLTLLLTLALVAQGKVTVVIDYGEVKPQETKTVEWSEGMTALTALQHCADVETHPVQEYVFVRSINGVQLTRGEMAWYYQVNGERSTVLALKKMVKDGDTVTWMYKKDVCSPKVDQPKK